MKKMKLALLIVCLLFAKAQAQMEKQEGQSYENEICKCIRFGVGVDYIFWKNFQDNIEFANHIIDSGDQTTLDPLIPHFHADSGVRVFAEYFFCDKQWKVRTSFVHIFSTGDSRKSLNPATIATEFITLNAAVFPVFGPINATGVTFANISSSWRSRLNFVDVDLSRSFCMLPRISVTPHLGVRALWLWQRLHLNGATAEGVRLSSNFTGSFDAVGVEGGLNANFKLCWGLSLEGEFSVALLYSRTTVDEVAALSTGLTSLTKHDIHHSSPMLDAFIGLRYEGICCCLPYSLRAGWEQHVILNANHFRVFAFSNLSLQGLTVGGELRF